MAYLNKVSIHIAAAMPDQVAAVYVMDRRPRPIVNESGGCLPEVVTVPFLIPESVHESCLDIHRRDMRQIQRVEDQHCATAARPGR